MPSRDPERFEPLTPAFICPFCGGTFQPGEVEGEPTVMHSVPLCETFQEKEIDDFLRAARETGRLRPANTN